jgi:hypothetical protein
VRLEKLGKLKKKIDDIIGTRTPNLSVHSIAPQPSTLPRPNYFGQVIRFGNITGFLSSNKQ